MPSVEPYTALIQALDQGLQKRQKGSFGKPDVENIYKEAREFFNKYSYVEPKKLDTIAAKWVELSNGKIDKGRAMKKLQGGGCADAIKSILMQGV